MHMNTDNKELPQIPVTMPTLLHYVLMTVLIDSLGNSGHHTSLGQSGFFHTISTASLSSPGEIPACLHGGCYFNLSL